MSFATARFEWRQHELDDRCGLQYQTRNTHQQPDTWNHICSPGSRIRQPGILRLEHASRTHVHLIEVRGSGAEPRIFLAVRNSRRLHDTGYRMDINNEILRALGRIEGEL